MDKEFIRVANGVSLVSIVSNIALSVFKLIAGVLAHSSAMVSDAVHSASDVFSTFEVLIGIKLCFIDNFIDITCSIKFRLVLQALN